MIPIPDFVKPEVRGQVLSKRIRESLACAALMLVAVCRSAAADPGDDWLTKPADPPDGAQWLAPASLCRLNPGKLPSALEALGSKAFEPLTADTVVSYAGVSCKGRYGQRPYLVRAVSTAGEGRLDAGLFHGELWLRFAGLGGRYPFEKTPVVLWLYGPPARVHVIANLVL